MKVLPKGILDEIDLEANQVPSVIASAAKQSQVLNKGGIPDCFVAFAPRNDRTGRNIAKGYEKK